MSDNNSQIVVSDFVKKNYPDLIPMLLGSESMTDNERQYWLSLLPIMTKEQVDKLRNILLDEKKQLADLEHQYKNTINEFKNFDLTARALQPSKRKEKHAEIKKLETAQEKVEANEEAKILEKLKQV